MTTATQTTLLHAAELLEAQAGLSPASVLSDVLYGVPPAPTFEETRCLS